MGSGPGRRYSPEIQGSAGQTQILDGAAAKRGQVRNGSIAPVSSMSKGSESGYSESAL
ncbi:MAG: hypothetical protein PF694_04355 [Bacteroidetes bacterium]|nr:hypothetical protein [Bacteroidota bacterium]